MIIHPGEVHSAEAQQRERGWNYCAFYPSESLTEAVAQSLQGGKGGVNFGRDVMRHDPMVARGILQVSLLLSQSECHFRTHFGITPGAFGAACR